MILNSFSPNTDPIMMTSDGETLLDTSFEMTEYVEAHGSCMTSLNGIMYMFGGVQQKRQLSRLEGCEFDRIGSTQFDFSYGACGTFVENGKEFALLCFDHNHPYLCYV